MERPSEDVDLFTVADSKDRFDEAVSAAIEAYRAAGLTVEILRHSSAFARLHLIDGQGGQVQVEMGIDWRAHPPVTLEIGAGEGLFAEVRDGWSEARVALVRVIARAPV